MADPFEPSSQPTIARPFLEFRPLLRALGIASDPRKLVLAVLGIVVFTAGGLAFSGLGSKSDPVPMVWEIPNFAGASTDHLRDAGRLMTEPFRVVVSPFASLFTRGTNLSAWFRSALMAVWAVVAWGIFGGAIARVAVVQATGNGQIGLTSALRFAFGKSVSLVGAPLTPLFTVAIFAGFCGLFGLLYRIPGAGPTIAGFLGFIPLLLGLIMALILISLAVGWPLMIVTVAAEAEDAPDALSRSYSYVNQRLVRYAAHAIAGLAIGSIGLIVVIAFAKVVLGLADWGVSLGAPDLDGLGLSGTDARLLWPRLVGLLVHAWVYSYFWSAASIVYLILRRDVDGTAWQAVYLPEHASDAFAGDPGPQAELS